MREFVISVGNQTVSCLTAIFVNPAAALSCNLEFLRFWFGQAANATSAQQRCTLATKVTSFPTLTSTAGKALKSSDTNASLITGGTAGAAGTSGTTATAEGAGASTSYWEDAFNVLNGWLHVPTPPETKIMNAGSLSGLQLMMPVVPTTSSTWSYGLVFREV
jgi:hypothetical protein